MVSQIVKAEKLNPLAESVLLRAYTSPGHVEGWHAHPNVDLTLAKLGLLEIIRQAPEGRVYRITNMGRAYIRQHPIFAAITAPRPLDFYVVDFTNRRLAQLWADALENDVIRLNLPVSVLVYDCSVVVSAEGGEE